MTRTPLALASILAILLVIEGCMTPRVGQHAYSSALEAGTSSATISYLLYLPQGYGSGRAGRWPLILFLHGMGERGSDLEALKRHPLPEMLETRGDFPFIVVSPQLTDDCYAWDGRIELLDALITEVQGKYSVDPRRIYLTGLSMGGAGTWAFALAHPDRFAAIVPVAGFYRYQSREVPPDIGRLKDLPIWVFQGAKDTSVQLYQAEVLVEALRARGSGVRFTVYADAGHEDTWRRAYADPALFQWLAAQSLP
jgi:predicted peptidase